MEMIASSGMEDDAFFKEKKQVKNTSQDLFVILQNILLAIALAEEEQKRIFQNAKENKEKTIEKKTEITKDKKDITEILDDDENKEKLKDKFMDDILSITIDMDGFESFHIKQYEQQLANYARFLAEYLEAGARGIIKNMKYSYNSDKKEEQIQKTTEVQMISYSEIREHSRATAMNGIFGGGNHVDAAVGEQYRLWSIFQHNQHMSFYYTAQWRSA